MNKPRTENHLTQTPSRQIKALLRTETIFIEDIKTLEKKREKKRSKRFHFRYQITVTMSDFLLLEREVRSQYTRFLFFPFGCTGAKRRILIQDRRKNVFKTTRLSISSFLATLLFSAYQKMTMIGFEN